MPKITDAEILARIEQEERIAYGINDSSLADDRAKAIDYYLGAPLGNEVEGRSQVVSFDVQDTIEAALPQLIKIFASGDQVVRFEPRTPADEAAAEQETDYLNYIVMERNRGFEVLYTWFKDAMLSKNGYIKVYYEEKEEVEVEQYQGLTEAQLMQLVQDENIEVTEHESYIDQQQYDSMMQMYQQQIQQYQMQMQQMQQQPAQPGQPPQMPPPPQEPQPPMLHNVKIEVRENRGCIKVKNVAPENMMVSIDTPNTCLQESRFVQHRESMSKSSVEETFGKIDAEVGYEDTDSFQIESNARDLYDEQFDRTSEEADDILVRDTYIMIEGERWRYVLAGNSVVLKEKTECVPFACLTPMLMPHRHVGRSYADLTMDIQLVKTALVRGQLDNMYLSNNGRYAISDRVNLEDMLTSRPGGVVRVQGEPGNAILPLQHNPFPPTSFTMVEYLDSMKEKRTGVTAYNQGLDADSLNKTATGINAIMQASAARLELVARLFAETGVKDLFLLVHRLIRQNYTKTEIVRLRGKWVEVDPRSWKTRHDMTVNVGLGTGNKDQQLMHIQTILAAQMQAMQIGNGVVNPKNIYNALIKLTQNAGFKHPDEFWTDPTTQPPQPPPTPPEVQVEQMRLQAKQQELQMKQQSEQQKFQAETQLKQSEMQMQLQVEQQKAEQQLRHEQMRSENDVAIERDKLQMQAELERFKAELKAETDLKIAAMEMQMKQVEMERQAELDRESQIRQQMMHTEKIEAMTKAKKVTRDENGRVSGVE